MEKEDADEEESRTVVKRIGAPMIINCGPASTCRVCAYVHFKKPPQFDGRSRCGFPKFGSE
jgi:hypothetical protein